MQKILIVLLLGFSGVLLTAISLQPPKPLELIFLGGNILTLEAPASVEAMWIRDGRIAGLGKAAELRQQAPKARVVDLNGTSLMPGFIEPHTHPLGTAMLSQAVDVSGFSHKTRASIMAVLEEAASGFAWREWIIAFGWDPAMLGDLEPPTLEELDAIAPERPLVILTQMMHDAYLNSAALKAIDVKHYAPNPPGTDFVRDAAGKLTGTAREVRAINRVFDAMPPVPKGAPAFLLNRQYADYAKAGYTTIGVLGPVGRTEDPIGIMQSLAEDPGVAVRTVIYGLPYQLEDPRWQPGLTTAEGRFILRGVKFWLDGSPWAGGAAWDAPYADTTFVRERLHLPAGHKGTLNYSDTAFSELFAKYHREGYQIAMHSQGERAARQAMSTAQSVQTAFPRDDHRHRLEHNALITGEQLKQLKTLGMTPSFFIDHIRYYGHRLPDLVGETRANRYMPVATAFKAGHRVSLHADSPGTRIGALRLMQSAVLRETQQGALVVGPNERIDREQALRAVTINAAWQLGVENERGSLAVGKYADLVQLSADPLTTPAEALTEIQVMRTWIEGRPVKTSWFTAQNLSLIWALIKGALFG